MLKIMQWLWTAHFSLTNQVCGIMIQWGLFTIKSQLQMYIHVGTAWWLKGHNPGLKGFRCVQLHNVWWQQIPIPHCSWEKWHLSGVNTTWFYLKCPVVSDFPKLAEKLSVIRTDRHVNLVGPKNILLVRKKSPKKFTVTCIMFSLAFSEWFSICNWAPDFTSGFYRG